MAVAEHEIPPGLRALWQAGGPILRLRILRDMLGRDESFLDTAALLRELLRLREVQELITKQSPDGLWNESFDQTVFAVLRLSELGLETSAPVQICTEKLLLPSLAKMSANDARPEHDTILYLLARTQKPVDVLVKAHLETVLTRIEQSTSKTRDPHFPTFDAYGAICCYPWEEDEIPRVVSLLAKLHERAEADTSQLPESRFQLRSKEYYLTHPERLFYELELSARAGITHECAATRWMFDEVEARQDADGWVRFEDTPTPPCPPLKGGESVLPWYFPLEITETERLHIEWTVRSGIVFKLLEYDF